MLAHILSITRPLRKIKYKADTSLKSFQVSIDPIEGLSLEYLETYMTLCFLVRVELSANHVTHNKIILVILSFQQPAI
jgi:hypothetical protein